MYLVRAVIRLFSKNARSIDPVSIGGARAAEPPVLVELGRVRDVVLGNSSSGNSDSNSQYYW